MAHKVWIVAAGTGGHIFPGLSIAKRLKKDWGEAEVLFLGTEDRLEAKLIPENGEKIHFVKSARWKGVGLLGRLVGLWALLLGFLDFLLYSFREGKADLLISVGGYVSFPVALACLMRRVPVVIVEPNVAAGMANRLVSRWARFAIANPGSDAANVFGCPVYESGTPVRSEFSRVVLRPHVKRVLVLGGSQGARDLNLAMLEAAGELQFGLRGIQLLIQAGSVNQESIVEEITKRDLASCVQSVAFIQDMQAELSKADLVVSRAGASTVTELCAAGVPSILVPYPFAADNHQMKNARMIEKTGGVIVVDQVDKNFSQELQSKLKQLCLSSEQFSLRSKLAEGIFAWARPKALDEIVLKLDDLTQQ